MGSAAQISTGARLHLPHPASSPFLWSSKSGPGKGASWKWWREGKCLFFSYHGFWIWTRERLGSRGRRRRVEELRRDQGPIQFCLLEEPVDLRLIHPSASSPRELLSGDFEKILLGISKALRGSGGHCVSSCGRAPLGPIRCENPMVSISAGALD